MPSSHARMPDAAQTGSRTLHERRVDREHALLRTALAVMLTALFAVLSGASAPAFALPTPMARTTPEDAAGFPWSWPVNGARTVTAPFRAPAHEYGPGHRGMDIAAGSPVVVRAPAAGVVAFRGTVVDRPLLTIDHGDGYVTTWEPMDSELTPGDVVEEGMVIGTVAGGGHAVRGTLHVGVRVDDVYVNPRPLFGEVPRAVLLPCCD